MFEISHRFWTEVDLLLLDFRAIIPHSCDVKMVFMSWPFGVNVIILCEKANDHILASKCAAIFNIHSYCKEVLHKSSKISCQE